MLQEISQFPLYLVSNAKCTRETFRHDSDQYQGMKLQESGCFYDFKHFQLIANLYVIEIFQ